MELNGGAVFKEGDLVFTWYNTKYHQQFQTILTTFFKID